VLANVTVGIAIMAIQTSTGLGPALSALLSDYAKVEQAMNAVERLEEYNDVEPEKFEAGEDKIVVPDTWPTLGNIKWTGAVARYRADLNPILQGLNLEVHDGEKVGIVGRTGAGKSTLFLTLFRILELSEGTIELDGVDVSKLDLKTLRSKLAIIPQEPVLFAGTLRTNLDPLKKFTDEEVWAVVEQARLKEYAESEAQKNNLKNPLLMPVTDGGKNFSSGQRQLICLARALLVNARILILDEATASVDVETDALIQETIATAFSTCTILSIAHRLNTVIDSDKILVLQKGKALEFAHPRELLADPESEFSAMVNETGPENAHILRQVANGELDIKEAIAASNAARVAKAEAEEKAKAEAKQKAMEASKARLETSAKELQQFNETPSASAQLAACIEDIRTTLQSKCEFSLLSKLEQLEQLMSQTK